MPRQRVVDVHLETDLQDPATLRLMNRQPREGDRIAAITGRLDPSGHVVKITVQYRDGAYRVVEVAISASDGELTSAVLGMPVKETADHVLSKAWAMFGSHETGREFENRASEFRALQRQRLLDDDFLREVARVYSEAEQTGSPSVIDAVATRLGPVAYSSAQRWVSAARKREFLPPARRGRPTRKET